MLTTVAFLCMLASSEAGEDMQPHGIFFSPIGMDGYTVESFGNAEKKAFAAAIAGVLNVTASDVHLPKIRAKSAVLAEAPIVDGIFVWATVALASEQIARDTRHEILFGSTWQVEYEEGDGGDILSSTFTSDLDTKFQAALGAGLLPVGYAMPAFNPVLNVNPITPAPTTASTPAPSPVFHKYHGEGDGRPTVLLLSPSVGMDGYTVESFGNAEQKAFAVAIAGVLNVTASDVALHSIKPKSDFANKTGLFRARLLGASADGIFIKTYVTFASERLAYAKSNELMFGLHDTFSSDLDTKFQAEIGASGLTLPVGYAMPAFKPNYSGMMPVLPPGWNDEPISGAWKHGPAGFAYAVYALALGSALVLL
jgi:hypothetical protein